MEDSLLYTLVLNKKPILFAKAEVKDLLLNLRGDNQSIFDNRLPLNNIINTSRYVGSVFEYLCLH